MSDSRDFELPKATEKLSHKFILDSLNEERKIEAEIALTETASQCGTQAELPIDIEQEPHESIPMDDLKLEDGKKYFRIALMYTSDKTFHVAVKEFLLTLKIF